MPEPNPVPPPRAAAWPEGHRPTPFQAAVVRVVAGLRRGDLVTYGEVAEEAGAAGAAQAVANVLRAAPDLPWWRVLPGDGRLYRTHVATQGPLLEAEGHHVDDERRVHPRPGRASSTRDDRADPNPSEEDLPMAKAPKAASTRKPPEPSEDHGEIEDWMRRVMPDLQPVVTRLDELVRTTLPKPQHYALKWKKAHYGVPDHGWVIELVAYDVSVNIVFFGGADFDRPPPLGSGRSRYVKLTSVEEVDAPELRDWIEQAGRVPGWT